MPPLSESPTAIGYVRGLLGGADRSTAEAVVDEIDSVLPIGWDDPEAVMAVLSETDTGEGRDLLAELWGIDLDRRLGAIADRTGADVDDVEAVASRLVLLIGIEADRHDDHIEVDGGEHEAADEAEPQERRGLRRLLRGRSK